jgi:predicted MPP superfamily phosphohydrolase
MRLPEIKLSRRRFLFLSTQGALGAYAFLAEPRWFRTASYFLQSSKWPKDAKPLHIAFASDFHVGCPSVSLKVLQRVVDDLNSLKADIIVMGGDFLIKGVLLGLYVPPAPIGEVLSALKAPLGVYSVLGNHDWWDDGPGMWQALEKAGISVLENSALKIKKDGFDIWVAGMADDTTRHPDYAKTMAMVKDDAPVIMLAHDPANFMDVDHRPVVTLCGHTHGGQVTIPYVSPVVIPGRAPLKYAYGHVREERRDLIVTGGIGTSILPARFGRRPEIVSIKISHENMEA